MHSSKIYIVVFRVSFETMDALGIKERGGSSLIGEEELEELLQKLYTIIEHDCEANMQENFVRTSDDEEDTVESPTTVCDKDFKVCSILQIFTLTACRHCRRIMFKHNQGSVGIWRTLCLCWKNRSRQCR